MNKTNELQQISLATTYEIDKSFDSDKFIKMRLRVCHDGENPNKSFFKVEDMEKAKDSIVNIPILANVIFDEDGNPQFGGHDMVLEDSKVDEGEVKLIYKETPIGLVPETCNYEIQEYNDKNYVYCDAYIWRGYANYSEDIIERDENIKLSMEIIVDEYSYNAKEKIFNITDYRYQGITFLNKNYGTGMEDAMGTIGTFDKKDESKEKLVLIMQELKDALTKHNANIEKEGGSNVDEKMELLKEYNVTIDELSFDIEELAVEEVKDKLEELYRNKDDGQKQDNDEPEKFVKSFELSHEDIRYSLYRLLTPVEDEDDEWYFIDRVYDDNFEYINWDGTKIYRQYYKVEDDIVSFTDDRIELFQERLTAEEKEELDKIRSEYSSLVAEFEDYKNNYSTPNSEVERLQNFESTTLANQRKEAEEVLFEQFVELSGIEEFENLKKNSADYELDALEKECYAILGRKTAKFSNNKQNKPNKVKVGFTKSQNNNTNEYDYLFDKYLKNKEEK